MSIDQDLADPNVVHINLLRGGIAKPSRAQILHVYTDLRDEIEQLREALSRVVNAEALAGVRGIVAGWNGDGKPDGPYKRHHRELGATLPKTNCGAVYALDEALEAARSLLNKNKGMQE